MVIFIIIIVVIIPSQNSLKYRNRRHADENPSKIKDVFAEKTDLKQFSILVFLGLFHAVFRLGALASFHVCLIGFTQHIGNQC